MSTTELAIVFAIYPDVTQLDFTGPHQVLSRAPGAKTIVASAQGGPVKADDGLVFADTVALANIPSCDIICTPGGPGFATAVEDAEYMANIRRLAAGARYVTSVCVGSLILGAAGLLRGKRAACHWASRDFLSAYGAIPDPGRVVRDGNVLTGGGVTSGIDFALALVAELAGNDVAEAIQLAIEYAPAPPFNSGSPETARPEVLALAEKQFGSLREQRLPVVQRTAAQLSMG